MPPGNFLPAEITIQLPALPTALAQARQAVAEHLWRRVTPSELDSIKLVVTELIANSIRHAGLTSEHRIDVLLEDRGDHIRIEVSDAGPCLGAPSPPHDDGGRGLMLVAGLSRQWGWEKQPRCKVWSEVELSDRPQLRTSTLKPVGAKIQIRSN